MVLFTLALMLHTFGVIVWVGGLFFVAAVLMPAVQTWADTERFAVLARVVPLYFRWVWLAIVAIVATGYGVLLLGYRGGVGGGGFYVDAMQMLGIAMVLGFAYVDWVPWRAFLRARAAGDMVRATAKLHSARSGLLALMSAGFITAAIGATGSFWAN